MYWFWLCQGNIFKRLREQLVQLLRWIYSSKNKQMEQKPENSDEECNDCLEALIRLYCLNDISNLDDKEQIISSILTALNTTTGAWGSSLFWPKKTNFQFFSGRSFTQKDVLEKINQLKKNQMHSSAAEQARIRAEVMIQKVEDVKQQRLQIETETQFLKESLEEL